jgi:hypothetical protein
MARLAGALVMCLVPVAIGAQPAASPQYNEVENSFSASPIDEKWLKEPNGYAGVPWCTADAYAKATLSLSACQEVPGEDFVVCSRAASVAGVRATEDFQFGAHKLTGVLLLFPGPAVGAFLDELTKAFGPPLRHVIRTYNAGTSLAFDNEFWRWHGKTTQITIKRKALPDGRASAYFEAEACK